MRILEMNNMLVNRRPFLPSFSSLSMFLTMQVLKVLREIWSKQDSLERQFVDHRDIVQAELKKIGISDNSTEFATEKDYFEFCDNSTECKAGCEEPDLTLEGSAQLEGSVCIICLHLSTQAPLSFCQP